MKRLSLGKCEVCEAAPAEQEINTILCCKRERCVEIAETHLPRATNESDGICLRSGTSLRGYTHLPTKLARVTTPAPPQPVPVAKQCAWPECEQTKIKSRNLCSTHYITCYLHWKKIGGGQRTSKPFPTPAEVIQAQHQK